MDDERIDLSSLDPSADRARWERTIGSVVSRALEARRRQATMSSQLLAWSRPALALAAAAAAAVWIASWAAGPTRGAPERAATAASDPAVALSRWASGDDAPAVDEILEVLGGQHGER